ncbi:hypothetical protein [Vibrio sp.]|uniref:hypothetical protein n=1 Tax=Vibrio sp. TaxID=678 RepID=UPI00311E7326
MNRWKEEYLKNGYIIVDILSDVQSLGFRKILENEVLGLDKRDLIVDPTVKLLDGYFQKEGHKLDDYGNELKLYYINNVSFLDKCEKIRELYCNEKLMNISEEIIGENLALDGSALLLAETGTHYELAWHRDTIQIPQNEISDKLFTGEYFHNNVQINLALSYDESLWVVPGSHKRPLNKHEQEVFGMSKHYALDNCSLPAQN